MFDKLIYKFKYFRGDKKVVQMTVDSETIDVVLEEFKNFLLATGWTPGLVNRIQLLEDYEMEQLGIEE